MALDERSRPPSTPGGSDPAQPSGNARSRQTLLRAAMLHEHRST
jgi:hypothetical protein